MWRRFTAPYRKYAHLPQVKPHWFSGNRNLGRESFTDAMINHYNALKGERFGLYWESNEPALFVKDIELLKMIQVSDFDHFTDLGFNTPEYLEKVGNAFGIADMQGDHWKKMKKMVTPPFSVPRLKKTLPAMNIAAKRLVNYLKTIEKNEFVDAINFSKKFYMTNIASVAFGLDVDCFGEKESEFEKKGKNLISLLRFFIVLVFPSVAIFFKLKVIDPDAEKFFANLCKKLVSERKRMKIDSKDVLGNLMHVAEENPDMTEEMMYKTFVQFFTDGYETAAQAIGTLFYHLARNPDIQERIQEEIDDVIERKDDQDNISVEDINEMTYLDQVLSEGLRFGAAPFTARFCTKAWKIPGDSFVVPKAMKVLIPTAALHYDPKYWEEPLKFDPERFSPENKGKIEGIAYQPFGAGPRMCLGYNLVKVETKIMLVELFRNFSLKPYGHMPEKIECSPDSLIGAAEVKVKLVSRF